jgi:hypothetical protein
MLPVVTRNGVESIDDGFVAHLDCEFPPLVEAAGSKVDRAHECCHAVGQHHLAVHFQVLELVHLDSRIV